MRRFKGQKLSSDKDFFTHDDATLSYIPPTSNAFSITLRDIPKDELLETAAALNEDTFYKLGFRKHTVKQVRANNRRVVSSSATMTSHPQLLPPLPTHASEITPSTFSIRKNAIPGQQRVVSMFNPDTNTENDLFNLSDAPMRVKTSRNKLSLENDFYIGSQRRPNRSTDSLIAEIIETYIKNDFSDPELLTPKELPDLVECVSASSSSIDTASQFSFDKNTDDNDIIKRRTGALAKKSSLSSKPLPPIPVKKVQQSNFRDYQLSATKSIKLQLNTGSMRKETPSHSRHLSKDSNEYILTRTGGDNFSKPRETESVHQDEADLSRFTRKCSTSSSRYSSSSEEAFTAPTTPVSERSFPVDSSPATLSTAPSSPETIVNRRNPYSPRAFRRNLTPINENNGYETKDRLFVVND